jgi:hypothetical protein
VRETGGNSPTKRAILDRHMQGAGITGWSITSDITQDSLDVIFEDAEDLFT